jgi:hypothetical protein
MIPVKQAALAEGTGNSDLVGQVLRLVNAVRAGVGDPTLESLPPGSLVNSDRACPIAKALSALILLDERRIAFCYPWYASAAAKIWKTPFCDALLLSVAMPDAIYDFAVRFRSGALPELLEQTE